MRILTYRQEDSCLGYLIIVIGKDYYEHMDIRTVNLYKYLNEYVIAH
jgi:hypothetical protein